LASGSLGEVKMQELDILLGGQTLTDILLGRQTLA
jgi:hypothetical protein